MNVFVRAVIRAGATLARAQVAMTRASSNAIDVVGGVALYALREAELDRLAAAIYDEGSLHRSDRIEEWEDRWWSSALPKKPGRILVGGCGAGREIVWLLERGWSVDGFDPAPSLVATARARIAARGSSRATARVDVLDFAGFIAEARSPGLRGPYDAVLLGWGSVSHCLSDTARAQLLRACASVCPRGPVLLSWQDGGGMRGRQSRARALGARLGTALGALRGIDGAWRDGVLFLPHAGPTAFLDESEMRALASSVRRRLVFDAEVMPHGSLVPLEGRAARAVDHEVTELLADVLTRRGHHRIVAHGGSMKPAIQPASTIDIQRVDRVPIAAGQVVAARFHGAVLVHRVVGIDAQGRLLLKGDACPEPDGWIEPGAVLGRVTSVDDGSGPREVPPQRPSMRRWRRGVARVRRAAALLTRPRSTT